VPSLGRQTWTVPSQRPTKTRSPAGEKATAVGNSAWGRFCSTLFVHDHPNECTRAPEERSKSESFPLSSP
jgi:hypothetical protein